MASSDSNGNNSVVRSPALTLSLLADGSSEHALRVIGDSGRRYSSHVLGPQGPTTVRSHERNVQPLSPVTPSDSTDTQHAAGCELLARIASPPLNDAPPVPDQSEEYRVKHLAIMVQDTVEAQRQISSMEALARFLSDQDLSFVEAIPWLKRTVRLAGELTTLSQGVRNRSFDPSSQDQLERLNQIVFSPLPDLDPVVLLDDPVHADTLINLRAHYSKTQYEVARLLKETYKFQSLPIIPEVSSFDPEMCVVSKHLPPLPVGDPSRDGIVSQVLQRGYRLAGKLLRPAQVVCYTYIGSE